jgi:hypothetical protein
MYLIKTSLMQTYAKVITYRKYSTVLTSRRVSQGVLAAIQIISEAVKARWPCVSLPSKILKKMHAARQVKK